MQTVPAGRVAFLAHTPPLPLMSGERVRAWNLIAETARRGWEVSLFALLHAETAPDAGERARLEAVCAEVVLAPFAVSPIARRARMTRDLALGRSFHNGFFFSPSAAETCRRWLASRDFDAVVIETHYMVPYAAGIRSGRSLFDSQNCEARRMETMARALGATPRGLVARMQRGSVARFERRVCERAGRVLAVSEDDLGAFERAAPGRVDLVPNGVDCADLRPRSSQPAEPRILFLGSLDYSANVDALTHLIDHVLPRLSRSDATLEVVGSHPRHSVFEAARRSPIETTVTGYVPDATARWEAARLLVVPLRIGGGTRLKILEALARGVPVVTTSQGCEGLELEAGRDLLVADEPGKLAACIDRLLSDDGLCQALAAHGRSSVEARYDWKTIGGAFERSLLKVTGQS